MITGNEQVMPLVYEEEYGDYGKKRLVTDYGLTIRQHFAAMAMAAMAANPEIYKQENVTIAGIAVESVQYADALIAELNKK